MVALADVRSTTVCFWRGYSFTHSHYYHKFNRETKALLCPLMFEIQVIGLLQPSDSLRSHYHKANTLNAE